MVLRDRRPRPPARAGRPRHIRMVLPLGSGSRGGPLLKGTGIRGPLTPRDLRGFSALSGRRGEGPRTGALRGVSRRRFSDAPRAGGRHKRRGDPHGSTARPSSGSRPAAWRPRRPGRAARHDYSLWYIIGIHWARFRAPFRGDPPGIFKPGAPLSEGASEGRPAFIRQVVPQDVGRCLRRVSECRVLSRPDRSSG